MYVSLLLCLHFFSHWPFSVFCRFYQVMCMSLYICSYCWKWTAASWGTIQIEEKFSKKFLLEFVFLNTLWLSMLFSSHQGGKHVSRWFFLFARSVSYQRLVLLNLQLLIGHTHYLVSPFSSIPSLLWSTSTKKVSSDNKNVLLEHISPLT